MAKRSSYTSPFSLLYYKDKVNPKTNQIYTEEEAIIQIASYRPNSIHFWVKKGFSLEEAELKRKEFQTSQSQKSAVKRKTQDDILTNQIMYWVKRKGYSEEEAKKIVSERQKTFSKNKCIQKYGFEEGIKKWQERQDKWQNTLNSKKVEDIEKINSLKSPKLENFITKYGFEEGLNLYCRHRIEKGSFKHSIEKTKKNINPFNFENFNKIYESFERKRLKINGRASRESLKTIIPLYKLFRKKMKVRRENLRLGVGGSKEYVIRYKKNSFNNGKIDFFSYDFTCLETKIIIEHHNLHWHPSPYEMNENDFLSWTTHRGKKMSGLEKYKLDQYKKEIAEKEGFLVFEVWSHKNINEQIENIFNEIKHKFKDDNRFL